MSKRDPRLLLEDMITAIDKIQGYVADATFERFRSNQMLVDAVVRNLEIIGEASKIMPVGFRELHTDVPWKLIAGLRNRVIHEYFGVDLEIIWQVVGHDLQRLRPQLEEILKEA